MKKNMSKIENTINLEYENWVKRLHRHETNIKSHTIQLRKSYSTQCDVKNMKFST